MSDELKIQTEAVVILSRQNSEFSSSDWGNSRKLSIYPVSASTFEQCISGIQIRFAATPICLFGGVK
jgi:hypothetical protein